VEEREREREREREDGKERRRLFQRTKSPKAEIVALDAAESRRELSQWRREREREKRKDEKGEGRMWWRLPPYVAIVSSLSNCVKANAMKSVVQVMFLSVSGEKGGGGVADARKVSQR
jgi:hypothetical protein